MDEEDAAAPVGGDRGRGPRYLGSPQSLRREAGVLGEGFAVMGGVLRAGLEALPARTPGAVPGWARPCVVTLTGRPCCPCISSECPGLAQSGGGGWSGLHLPEAMAVGFWASRYPSSGAPVPTSD